jgi:hypothetical protein
LEKQGYQCTSIAHSANLTSQEPVKWHLVTFRKPEATMFSFVAIQRRIPRPIIGAISTICAVCVLQSASAESIPVTLATTTTSNASEILAYRIVNMPLTDLLTMLAEDANARVSQPDGLRGMLYDVDLTGDVSTILDHLSADHDLDWFAFNGVIHVSSKPDALTRLIPLDDISIAQARAALERSELSLDGKHINTAANETALAVYGGPAFIGIVEAILDVTPGVTAVQAPKSAIRERRDTVLSTEYFGDIGRVLVCQQPA